MATEAASDKRRWTYDELAAEMGETNLPCELWDGELVMAPAPFFRHQQVVFRLARQLDDFTRANKLGSVVPSPIDVIFTEHRVVQPDVVYISTGNQAIIQDQIRGVPDLVVEVISAGSWRRDRMDKLVLYEEFGVPEYWIVDPEAALVEVRSLERGTYRLQSKGRVGDVVRSALLQGFDVDVSRLLEKTE